MSLRILNRFGNQLGNLKGTGLGEPGSLRQLAWFCETKAETKLLVNSNFCTRSVFVPGAVRASGRKNHSGMIPA
eukprot:753641-Hanusia_phi.AAC.2